MMAVLVFCELGDQRYKQGRLHQAKTLYQQALELGTNEQGEQLPVAGKALIGLGDITREWNDFENAERFLTDGIALAEQWSVLGTFEGYLNLIMLKDSQGDTRTADEMFSHARELALQFDASEMDDLVVDMFAARRDIALGDLESARLWAEKRNQGIISPGIDNGKFDDLLIARMQKYENIILARLLIAEEQYAQALTLLEQVLPEAIQADRLMLIIEVESLRAIALQALGKKSKAIEVLTKVLRLAEPEGFMRLFVDHGRAIKELLEITRRGEKDKRIIDYIDRLLEAYTPRPGKVETAPSRQMKEIVDPLSDREVEVLRLLPTGLSSTEMAGELTISVNTLRTHLKSIYSKMGVHSRYEAIERARETGLL
jgi:LuxR family maltose regulon positive regulatory protein